MKFKVGDKVKVIRNNGKKKWGEQHNGMVGTIKDNTGGCWDWLVVFEDRPDGIPYNEHDLELYKNQLTYELLRPVSIKALEEAGACERELHRFAFLLMKDIGNTSTAYYTYKIPTTVVIDLAQQCKGGIRFLLDKGFILEKVERPDLKVDDPILVRDSHSNDWLPRHFKSWEFDGTIRVWGNHGTSWSTNYSFNYKYWKLPE